MKKLILAGAFVLLATSAQAQYVSKVVTSRIGGDFCAAKMKCAQDCPPVADGRFCFCRCDRTLANLLKANTIQRPQGPLLAIETSPNPDAHRNETMRDYWERIHRTGGK
jgi:hypothetical protein